MKKSLIQKSTQVPQQYFGYSLQLSRLLAHLLQGTTGSIISLEVLDDVATVKKNLSAVEQVKSSTGRGNPISNKSKDLWKTISNWVDAVRNNSLDLTKTEFVIYTSKELNGPICKMFSDAKTSENAKKALDFAKGKLWGKAPKYSNKNKVSSEISKYLTNIFQYEDIAIGIIHAFCMEFGSGASIDDLKSIIEQKFVAGELKEKVLLHLLGWIKDKTDSLIEKNLPACVAYDDFHKEAISYLRIIDRRTTIQGVAENPPQEAIQGHLKTKVYVKQLDIIGCDENEKISAINDFLKASIDRVYWAQAGLINEISFDELEKDLIRVWDNKKRSVGMVHTSKSDIDKGKILYYDCGQHKTTLEGLTAPEYFCPGSFHALSDVKKIGWHSNYLRLLEGKDEGNT